MPGLQLPGLILGSKLDASLELFYLVRGRWYSAMDLIQKFQAWETLIQYNTRVNLQPKHHVGQIVRKRWGPRGRKGEYWLAMVVFYDPSPNLDDPTDGHYQIVYNDGHPDVIRDEEELNKLRWTPVEQVQTMATTRRVQKCLEQTHTPGNVQRILLIQPSIEGWEEALQHVFPQATITKVAHENIPRTNWPLIGELCLMQRIPI